MYEESLWQLARLDLCPFDAEELVAQFIHLISAISNVHVTGELLDFL